MFKSAEINLRTFRNHLNSSFLYQKDLQHPVFSGFDLNASSRLSGLADDRQEYTELKSAKNDRHKIRNENCTASLAMTEYYVSSE